jgi:hypothetical protein
MQIPNTGTNHAKIAKSSAASLGSVVDPKLPVFLKDTDPTYQKVSDPDPITDPILKIYSSFRYKILNAF